MRARRTLIVALLFLGLSSQAVRTGAPALGATTPLPFAGFADLHVDGANRRVFVAGGAGTEHLLAFDFDGRPAGRVALAGAAGIVAEGDSLYVAAEDGDAIAVVDRKTLEVVDSVPTTPLSGPHHVSKVGDTIYFSHGCEREGDPGFGSVDLGTGVVLPHARPNPGAESCAQHAVAPSDPATLLAWDAAGSRLRRYDVSARQPVPTGETAGEELFDEVVFSRDGTHFYALARPESEGGIVPVAVSRRRVDDFTEVERYAPGGTAIALTEGERELFTGSPDGFGAPDLHVYRVGVKRALAAVEVSDYEWDGYEVVPGGIGVSPSGDRAFTVVRGPGGENASLRVVWPRYPVVGGGGSQFQPAGGGGFDVWTYAPESGGSYRLMARGRGRAFRVNPRGTWAFAGGIQGSRLVYQVVRGYRSDLRLYDLARRRQVSRLDRLNTPAWEWSPSFSNGRVLFSRATPTTERLVVHTLSTGRERVLAQLPERNRELMAGRINDSYVVWSQCYRVCSVFRMDLRTGRRLRIPGPKGRFDYAPSVSADGVVYFARSGDGCGTEARLLRFSGGDVTELFDLPLFQDVGSTYVVPGTDNVLFDVVECGLGTFDVVRIRDAAAR